MSEQATKEKLRDYFNGTGFERWSQIYGEGEVSGVRRSVRAGHRAMLDIVLNWLSGLELAPGAEVLDAGCGTGLLSVRLAQQGYNVTAVDIAPHMVAATRERAEAAGVIDQMTFHTSDLETISGRYDAVCCLDVLIHYPQPDFTHIVNHLTGLSRKAIYFTYAPHNPALALMHYIGGIFPRSQRRTDIQMIPDSTVREIIAKAGLILMRNERVSNGFYHIALVEAHHQ